MKELTLSSARFLITRVTGGNDDVEHGHYIAIIVKGPFATRDEAKLELLAMEDMGDAIFKPIPELQ
jgi:hypothetical protein